MVKKLVPAVRDFWLRKSIKDIKNARAILAADPDLGQMFSEASSEERFHLAANLVNMKRGSLQEVKFWGAIMVAAIGIVAKLIYNIKF